MEGVWQVLTLLWLIKSCVKLVRRRTTGEEWTKPQKTETKVKTAASEEEMWPLLEELSADKDEGAEEELQDQTQGVNRLNGKGISACISGDDAYATTRLG